MNSKNAPSIFTALKDTKVSELMVLTLTVFLLDSRKTTATDCYLQALIKFIKSLMSYLFRLKNETFFI